MLVLQIYLNFAIGDYPKITWEKSPITTKLKTWIWVPKPQTPYRRWSTTFSSWQWTPCVSSLDLSHRVMRQEVDFKRLGANHHCHCQTHSTAGHFWGCSWAGCFLVAGWSHWLWQACCCRAAGVTAVEERLGHCPLLHCWSCHRHFLRSSRSLRSCSHCCCSSAQ